MRWSINVFSDFLDHMYYFEGKDYSKDPSAEDEKTFELLLEKQLADLEDAGKEGRALRNKAGVTYLKVYTLNVSVLLLFITTIIIVFLVSN